VSATSNFAITRLQQRLNRHERSRREAADATFMPVEQKRDASLQS
jgi:hypothetical protein